MRYFMFFFLMTFLKLQAQLPTDILDSLLLYESHQKVISILKTQPQNAESLLQLGYAYQDKSDYYNALKYYRRASHLQPIFQNKLKIVQMKIKLQQYQSAEYLLKDLKKENPESQIVDYNLSKVYQRQHKHSKAIKLLEELMKKYPNNLDYIYEAGRSNYIKRKLSKAIDYFLLIFKKDSTHFNAIYQLSKTFQDLQLVDSTYVFIEKGEKLRPNHKNLNRILINQLRRDKEFEKAITVLEKQDTLYPNEFFNKKMLGVCNYNLNDYKKAEDYFNKAIELNPEDFKSFTYLGHISLKKKAYDAAYYNYLKATFINKISREKEFYGLAMVSIEKNKFEQAQQFLERAYKENRRDSTVLFELAKIIDFNTKGGKEAYQYFMRYVIDFPTQQKENLAYAEARIKKIREDYFLRGEQLE